MFRRLTAQALTNVGRRTVTPTVSRSLRIKSFLPRSQRLYRSSVRFHSTSNGNTSSTAQLKIDNPEMMIAFTCKKCDTRSSHVMSKQAYTSGTVLITCPGCKNRHLIADHLKIFSDDRITIQDILGAKGESVSSNTDDLVFDDIPDKLKDLIGHHAKDAPKKDTGESEKTHYLPAEEKKN